MEFDFDRFTNIAVKAYSEQEEGYTIEEALEVFRYYFEKYEECIGKPHPPIRAEQIKRILAEMPWIILEGRGGDYEEVSPACYRAMIDQHFQTKYRGCNYNINHFFSGRIRENRYFETLF